jgi:hypothetical protein
MKLFWMMSLILLGACGKVEVDSNVQLGTPKLTAPEKIGTSDVEKIQKICNALKEKERLISDNLSLEYVMSGSTKACTDSGFAPLADVSVKLVDQSGYKFFEGSVPYYFSDVETENSGILGQICQSLSLGVSPIMIGADYVFFDVDDSSDCVSGGNQQCIRVEKAAKSSDTEAKIFSREWIKVKLDQPNLGFWTYKKRISQSSCVDGYYFGRTATLK